MNEFEAHRMRTMEADLRFSARAAGYRFPDPDAEGLIEDENQPPALVALMDQRQAALEDRFGPIPATLRYIAAADLKFSGDAFLIQAFEGAEDTDVKPLNAYPVAQLREWIERYREAN
jgi:hypothetical protein